VANGNGKNGKRKWKWWAIGGVLLVAIVASAVTMMNGSTTIDPTKIAKVEKGPLAKSVVATGKIEPITKVEIKSKASGIVKKLYVDAGDTVKEGQLLAELDKEEIQARVNQQKAALEGSQANMRAAEADLERAKVDALGPDVPLLERAYQRAQKMATEGVVSQSQLDDAQKNYEMAVNKRDMARAQLTMAKAKLAQAQAQVQQNSANLAQTEQEYRNSTLVAPMNGVILSRDVEIGDAVSSILVMGSSATLVMTVGDISEVYVKGKVDEADIGKVYLGQPARIRVESFKDKTFTGKVTKISPMGKEEDNVTTFEVRASITNSEGELKPAMTANAEIILEEHLNVLTVPEAAVIYEGENRSVEVPDSSAEKGKRKVAVKIGLSNGAKAELLEGLKENDEVVLQ
jgi:HlyD family secretion protein